MVDAGEMDVRWQLSYESYNTVVNKRDKWLHRNYHGWIGKRVISCEIDHEGSSQMYSGRVPCQSFSMYFSLFALFCLLHQPCTEQQEHSQWFLPH